MSSIKLDGLTLASTANNVVNLDSSVVFPAGHVLQVVNNTFTTRITTTSSTYVDITNYSASITPSSLSNKVLVLIDACVGGSGTTDAAIAVYAGASLVTETRIHRVSAVDYNATISYIHSPSTTSSVTYQMKMKCISGTTVINQSSGMTCYITLMELAG